MKSVLMPSDGWRPGTGGGDLQYFVSWCHTSEVWETLWSYDISAISLLSPRREV
jgi:hypothetical protein